MVSKIKTDVIETAVGRPVKLTGQQGLKMSCLFNGTGVATVVASDNVSSITDNNTGNFTINFVNVFMDVHYRTMGAGGANNVGCNVYGNGTGALAGSVQVGTTNFANAVSDCAYNCMSALGNLA